MSEEKNYTSMDQNEFMKRMKAIASDLWGGIAPTEEDVEGFNRYIEAYKRGLAIEQVAVANKA